MSQTSSKPALRPRSKSRFSFKSNKSDGSSHKRKESLVESAAEKKKTHMSSTTKANPNAAINEAQPIALALEKPTITSLQNFRCNDLYGNPISDPDHNNPTRWRMERPLDTIRSFEVAIDRAHAHRQSTYMLTDQTPFIPPNRRASSHVSISHQQQGGYDYGARPPNAGYGASRSRESFGDHSGPSSYQGQRSYHGTPHNGYSPNGFDGRFDLRKRSDPALNKYAVPGVYPAVGNSRSKDTLNTGGSVGSDQWNNSTGPTSEEGSVERINGLARPIPSHKPSNASDTHYGYYENYGYSDEERGRPRQPMQSQRSQNRLPPQYMNGYPQQMNRPPQPPVKDGPAPPAHIQLGTAQPGMTQPGMASPPKPAAPQKRQSWLKRTFSSKQ